MATLVDTLVERLKKGIVSFTYMKKDGKERHAVGTLAGVGNTIKGTGKTAPTPWLLKYFDVECNGWRSFIIANLVSVGELRQGTMEEHHSICLALVVKLKRQMEEQEIVAFAYRKTDGSIRYAHGSLLADAEEDDRYFRYFDTDKNEERKFRIDSFIGFGEADEINTDSAAFFGSFGIKEAENETPAFSGKPEYTERPTEAAGGFSSTKIGAILSEHGISQEETEQVLVVDLLPYLDKEQLKDLIIRATTRLAEL